MPQDPSVLVLLRSSCLEMGETPFLVYGSETQYMIQLLQCLVLETADLLGRIMRRDA